MSILRIVAVAVGLVASLTRADSQEPKPAVVGVILQGGPWYAVVDGLKAGLEQLNLQEGKHLSLHVRDTQGDLKAVEEAARSFEREKASLIVTIADSVSLVAQKATSDIPLVFCGGTDSVPGACGTLTRDDSEA